MRNISDKPSNLPALDTQNIRSSFSNILSQSRRQSAPDISRYQNIEVRDYRTDTTKRGLYQWHLQDNDFPDHRAMPLSSNSKDLFRLAREEMPAGVEKSFIAQVDRPTVAVKNWMETRAASKQGHNAYPDVLSLGMARNPDAHQLGNPEFLADPAGNNMGALPDELRMVISQYVTKTYKNEAKEAAQEFADIADFYALVINKPKDEIGQTDADYRRENQTALRQIIDSTLARSKKAKARKKV